MSPFLTDHFDPDPPGRSFWQALRDLALGAVVVGAVAL
ncbi:hypothetical protein E5P2_00428 (plasmid) [Variovorax sp. PBL-E5]|nr:hypothetical protein E5P2_00428 [Variovorax sp. PBL-E5]